ncbi:MAG TPA: SDR family oxidoreductase, partial [Gemmatimonadales bacterium]|nr:SDR family oxidoreductase [Gemmatimonadales bacterium]
RGVRVARTLQPRSDATGEDVPCDLPAARGWSNAAAGILARHGAPDVVVSNAGAFVMRPLELTTDADIDAQLAVNLRAAFGVARAFLPAMQRAGRGVFIHLGSVADHIGFPGNAAYAASKYGLRGLHEALAAEYRGSGVRLTLVSPGPTDTDVWGPIDPDRHPGLPARSEMLRPADVADAIAFVATRPPNVHVDWLRLGPA